ncbi:MAG: hypothetical protein ACK4UO_08615 [Pseudolabrys sp.]
MPKHQNRPTRAGIALPSSGPYEDIVLELPAHTFDRIQAVAAKCDVTCENLIKVWLYEKLKDE